MAPISVTDLSLVAWYVRTSITHYATFGEGFLIVYFPIKFLLVTRLLNILLPVCVTICYSTYNVKSTCIAWELSKKLLERLFLMDSSTPFDSNFVYFIHDEGFGDHSSLKKKSNGILPQFQAGSLHLPRHSRVILTNIPIQSNFLCKVIDCFRLSRDEFRELVSSCTKATSETGWSSVNMRPLSAFTSVTFT